MVYLLCVLDVDAPAEEDGEDGAELVHRGSYPACP